MNPTESPHLHARFTTTGGDLVVVNAWRGKQAVGHSTGNPLNFTEFGRVVLTVRDSGGGVAVLAFTDEDSLADVLALAERGRHVALTRNHDDDKPHPDAPQETA